MSAPTVMRRRFRISLQRRLVLVIVTAGLLVTLAGVGLIYVISRHTLTQTIGANFQELAEMASRNLTLLISQHITAARLLANSQNILTTVEESNRFYLGTPDEEVMRRIFEIEGRWVHAQGVDAYLLEVQSNKATDHLRDFIAREEPRVHEMLLVTNERGAVVAATGRPEHYYYGDQPWWLETHQQGHGQLYLAEIDPPQAGTAESILRLAVPIMRGDQAIGVLTMVHRVPTLLAGMATVRTGQTDHIMLAGADGQLLFCSRFPVAAHGERSIQGLPPSTPAGWTTTRADLHFPGQSAITGYATVTPLGERHVAGPRWYVATSQDPAETYASVFTLLRWSALTGLLGAGLLAVLGSAFARRITGPIRTLQDGTTLIGEGHLDHQIQITTGDEIEELAQTFNSMARRLKDSYAGLDVAVKERTRELEARNRELVVLYTVASALNKSFDLDEILEEALTHTRQLFKATAAVAWMADWKTGQYSIKATQDLPVETTTSEGFIKLTYYVGQLIQQSGELFVSQEMDVDERLTRLRYRVPKFVSLVGVPLRSKQRLVGVLFLLWANRYELAPQDKPLLESVGTQIGIAVEHAILFTKNLLREMEEGLS